jgi:AraC-like DNA-binding protein
MQSTTLTTKGILNPQLAEQKFQFSRHLPSPDLRFFIERYWIIHWDLRGEAPHVQETLSYPCVNLVFERERTAIWGVDTGKFARLLEGKGVVFGVKFRAGAFYPFIQSSVSDLTDRSITLKRAFGVDSTALENAIFSQASDAAMIPIVEDFLRVLLPPDDQNVTLVNRIIDHMMTHPTLNRVDEVVDGFDLSKRSLQRLFRQYVGVSPKWVIQRFRLQEAAERLERGEMLDLARLAANLGYFDQAHFIKDFKSVVGMTPVEYAKHVAAGQSAVG